MLRLPPRTGSRISIRVATALTAALILTAAAPPVVRTLAPHEEAVLKSPRSTVAAGDSLPLVGTEFEAGESYELRLQGALSEVELPSVKADKEGEFRLSVRVPPDVRPGTYRVVAIAPDGDEAAALDVTILPGAMNQATAEQEAAGQAAGAAGAGEHARAEAGRADAIPIERSRSGAGWGVIGLLTGLAGGLGVSLWRRG